MEFENIISKVENGVAIITLNRRAAMNAFNDKLMNELQECIISHDANPKIKTIIITGNNRAFAIGADIAEMAEYTFEEVTKTQFITRNWEAISRCRKPVIAAVAGMALGGGCEIAMMCDIIIASENAKFAQPEIKLGVIPGAGATQRLTNAVGKAKAMDLILTGRMISAYEAEKMGLVSRVVPNDELLPTALDVAQTIASYGSIAVLAAKEAINNSFETGLSQGIAFERRLFHAMFATGDQKEGMSAYLGKRAPNFNK